MFGGHGHCMLIKRICLGALQREIHEFSALIDFCARMSGLSCWRRNGAGKGDFCEGSARIIYRFDFQSAARSFANDDLPIVGAFALPSSRSGAAVGDDTLSTIVDKKRISASSKTTSTIAQILIMAFSSFVARCSRNRSHGDGGRKQNANRLFARNL